MTSERGQRGHGGSSGSAHCATGRQCGRRRLPPRAGDSPLLAALPAASAIRCPSRRARAAVRPACGRGASPPASSVARRGAVAVRRLRARARRFRTADPGAAVGRPYGRGTRFTWCGVSSGDRASPSPRARCRPLRGRALPARVAGSSPWLSAPAPRAASRQPPASRGRASRTERPTAIRVAGAARRRRRAGAALALRAARPGGRRRRSVRPDGAGHRIGAARPRGTGVGGRSRGAGRRSQPPGPARRMPSAGRSRRAPGPAAGGGRRVRPDRTAAAEGAARHHRPAAGPRIDRTEARADEEVDDRRASPSRAAPSRRSRLRPPSRPRPAPTRAAESSTSRATRAGPSGRSDAPASPRDRCRSRSSRSACAATSRARTAASPARPREPHRAVGRQRVPACRRSQTSARRRSAPPAAAAPPAADAWSPTRPSAQSPNASRRPPARAQRGSRPRGSIATSSSAAIGTSRRVQQPGVARSGAAMTVGAVEIAGRDLVLAARLEPHDARPGCRRRGRSSRPATCGRGPGRGRAAAGCRRRCAGRCRDRHGPASRRRRPVRRGRRWCSRRSPSSSTSGACAASTPSARAISTPTLDVGERERRR